MKPVWLNGNLPIPIEIQLCFLSDFPVRLLLPRRIPIRVNQAVTGVISSKVETAKKTTRLVMALDLISRLSWFAKANASVMLKCCAAQGGDERIRDRSST
jgi:hypothetical protein